MSKQNKTSKSLSLAIGATFVASMAATPMASAATTNSNPFAMSDLHSGYSQLADAKCGSSMNQDKTSTEGNCSGNKAKSSKEGNCSGNKTKGSSEGKCGGSK